MPPWSHSLTLVTLDLPPEFWKHMALCFWKAICNSPTTCARDSTITDSTGSINNRRSTVKHRGPLLGKWSIIFMENDASTHVNIILHYTRGKLKFSLWLSSCCGHGFLFTLQNIQACDLPLHLFLFLDTSISNENVTICAYWRGRHRSISPKKWDKLFLLHL